MHTFPRTTIESLSVPRLIMGTNWILGFSHTSKAKDDLIRSSMDVHRMADVMVAFLEQGVDAILGFRPDPVLVAAVKEAEDRAGRKMIRITTPGLNVETGPKAEAENARTLDAAAAIGASVCMPHQGTTDALLDRTTKRIRGMDRIAAMIRERGMIPGLSTHMPETIPYADASGLDVATYIQIYNAIGFLMQVEVDWVNRIIWDAKKPVITIKPLAAGKLMPLAGLAFAWSTIRAQDMVCIGCMTPDEAREVIELSRALIERRRPQVELQTTRSKESLKA